MPSSEAIYEAELSGFEAGFANEGYSPYPYGSELWKNWDAGFKHGREFVAELERSTEQRERPTALELAMYNTILGLTAGGCWCGMGIGNPMFSTHSARCMEARRIVKTFEVEYPEYSERLP